MKHVVLLLALLLCIPTAIALDIPVKNSSTDDVGGINTPTQLVNGDMVKMDFKITIGTQPLNGQIMLKVPPGWPLPQSDNSSLDNYTVAVKAQGTTGSVTSFYSKDDTIIANISNGQSNDLFYINYGVGQSVRVPYNFGYYDFHLQINRNGTFEDVQNSPISVEVAPGDWTRTLVLFPGESHLPASVEGIGGIRDDIRTGELVNVTFLAVDLASNIVSVNSTFEFGIFVSNPFAYPPSGYVEPLTLVNGVGQGQVTYNLAGENYLSIIDQNLADIANYTLSVLPGPFEKVISLLPHQTISPGDENSQGRTGIARTWIAGVPMPVKVHATDRFFNIQHGYHGDFTAIFTDSSNNTISVNGQFIDGNGSFTVILPSKDTYELNCTHATAHDVNDVPALLGGILRKGSDDMTAEIDQIAGPFEVILEDEFGNPFEGGAVEFALSPALQGQYLLVNSSLTTGNGAAQSMVHTGKMLGTYNIEATCGQVSNSPVSFNISVIDLTPPTSWVTTENLTVGPNFSIGFDYQDHGGGNVQFVELLISAT
ncbi:MAG TPA: hypothetical protein ENN76_00295, partial [Euryarchaeota archaeon]|nr:hypothetical protein [Euryarchaeota archaeon]